MSRVVPEQADLFAPDRHDPSTPTEPPPVDPVVELKALLVRVRGASVLPWKDAASAMVEELRTLWLAGQAGDEGAKLAAAIFEETERLFSAAEASRPIDADRHFKGGLRLQTVSP